MIGIGIQAELRNEEVTIKDDTLDEIIKYFDAQHETFRQAATKVFRKTTFEILILLIRYCPVMTGRLRGSWTPYLDRYGKASSYTRYLEDKSLVRSAPATATAKVVTSAKKPFSADQVSAGKAEGFFTDHDGVVTVGSNVVYASLANRKSGYFDRTVEQGDRIINANFENFLEASKKAGWIPGDDFGDEPRPTE